MQRVVSVAIFHAASGSEHSALRASGHPRAFARSYVLVAVRCCLSACTEQILVSAYRASTDRKQPLAHADRIDTRFGASGSAARIGDI
jgi:hypothetical protein